MEHWSCFHSYAKQKTACIRMQKTWRCYIEGKRYDAQKMAVEVLQTNIRMAGPHGYLGKVKRYLVTAQAAVRRFLANRKVKEMLGERFLLVGNQLVSLWDASSTSWLRRAIFLGTFHNISVHNLLALQEEGKRLATEEHETKQQLLLERKGIYNKLRIYKPPMGVNELYIKWNVDPTGKKRKHQLLHKLLSNGTNYEQVLASSEVLLGILGIQRECETNGNSHAFGLKEFDRHVNTTSKKVVESAQASKCIIM